ncbi:MAG: protein kinase domain-containing protein [Myxococcota bacterium]
MASGTDSGAGDALIGRTLAGRYRVDRLLGRGGMGSVYAAEHMAIERPVALKVLAPHLSEDPAQVERFNQEARASSRLEHPNTIRVFDYGQSEDGQLFLAMELLEGEELSRVIRREGALEPARAVRIARQMGKSIGEAHQAGVIHRDLKPDNVFLSQIYGERDFVKVLDFGIAKFTDGSPAQQSLTQTGFIAGTPLYIAPEHALGQQVTARTDLYSLGVMLYEMLTGVLPFRADTPLGIVMKHIHEAPPPLREKKPDLEIPRDLEALVLRLLSKKPKDRPASAKEVGDALDAVDFSGSSAPPARRFKDFGVGQEEETVLSGAAMDPHEAQPSHAPEAEVHEPTPARMPAVARRSHPGTLASRPSTSGAGAPAETGAIGVGQGQPATTGSGGDTSPWAVAGAVLAAMVVILGGGVTLWFTAGPGAAEEEPPAASATASQETTGAEGTEAAGAETNEEPVPIRDDRSRTAAAVPPADGEAGAEDEAGAEVHDTVSAEGEGAEEEAPEPEPARVEIRTQPVGAEIVDGEESLGQAPVEVSVEAGGERSLTARLDGHRDAEITVPSDAEGPVEVTLEKVRPEPTARPKKGPTKPRASRKGGGSEEPVWKDWDE